MTLSVNKHYAHICVLIMQMLRSCVGEVPEVVLVQRDQCLFYRGEGGLFLGEVGIKIVHVLGRFLHSTLQRGQRL